MAFQYKATLYLIPVTNTELESQDHEGKFPGNFPSTAEDEGEARGRQTKETVPDRRELVFKPGNRIQPVGRASSNPSKGYVAGKRNGYFTSPVMSRYHAIIKMRRQKLFITDTNSMHGTYLNGVRLSDEKEEIKTGDRLTFGTQVTREGETFSPKDFDCEIVWESISPKSLRRKPTGDDELRRTSGYGVTAEDLMVSDGEVEKETDSGGHAAEGKHHNLDDTEDERSYSEDDDDFYEEEDEYMEEECSPISSAGSMSSIASPETVKGALPQWTDKTESSTTGPQHSATSEMWRKILMDTFPKKYSASERKEPMDTKEKNHEVEVELMDATYEKPRASKFSIGSLMNEMKETKDTKTSEIIIVDNEEDRYVTLEQTKGKGKGLNSGSKGSPIDLSDDDAEGELETDPKVEVVKQQDTTSSDVVENKSESDTESEDEAPEEADVKGDDEVRKKHWASSEDEVRLQKDVPSMGPKSVKETLPTETSPLPPVLFSHNTSFNSNGFNVPDVVQASELLQTMLRDGIKKPNYYEPSLSNTSREGQIDVHSIRRREFFAAREANAAALSATQESKDYLDSNRALPVPGLHTFKPLPPPSPVVASPAQSLPWVKEHPASQSGDGTPRYGLFPILQDLQPKEQIQPPPSKPVVHPAGNTTKPNIYEQILSSDAAKARQADLDRLKAHYHEYLKESATWPGTGEDDIARSENSEDIASDSDFNEDLGECIEDVQIDIRTDVSEAGSNATSTERRNAALMTDHSDALPADRDDWISWRPGPFVETPAARGFPISSLVNQHATEASSSHSISDVIMQDSADKSAQVFELDVAASRGTKRKFVDEDMLEQPQQNEGADQKEVAEALSSPQSLNSEEDVPKEVTLDSVMSDVASMDLTEAKESSNEEPPRKRQRNWSTITQSFALGAVMGGVGVFAALVASAP